VFEHYFAESNNRVNKNNNFGTDANAISAKALKKFQVASK
jgi:hypothetical protein